jgi:hypothetical protein
VVDATLKELSDALLGAFELAMAEQSGSFRERETAALGLANEVMRRWTELELGRIAARYEDEVFVDGQRYRRHASGARRYHSLCGSVEVQRNTYRLVGIHNGPTVVPLEIEAGIVENATPALASSVLQAFAMMPLRDYEEEMRAAHREVPSRSTLERIAKRTGAVLHDELPVLEPILRAQEVVPRHAHSISLGLDRTTVPMAELTGHAPPPRGDTYVREPPAPVTVVYRMAYIATLALNDRHGDAIKTTRIAATAHEGATELMERVGAELEHLLEQRPKLPVVVVQDGAPELWVLVEEWLANFRVPIAMKLIDRYHVDERLAQTAEAIEPDRIGRWRLLDKWHASLGRSDSAIKRIYKRLDELLGNVHDDDDEEDPSLWSVRPPPVLRGANARITEGHSNYFRRYADKMHYATARERGFPIGSGVTEGACKSVIAARFKRSGQRWLEPGLSPCLQLRTMHLNGRLTAAFQHHIDGRRRSLVIN